MASLYLFNVGEGLVLGLGGGRQDRKGGRCLWLLATADSRWKFHCAAALECTALDLLGYKLVQVSANPSP